MKTIKTRHDQGFTMIEILFSVFLVSLIGVAIWSLETSTLSFERTIYEKISRSQEARKVAKMFSSEVRSMEISDNGSYPIAEATTDSFSFYSDIDRNGSKERVKYFLTSGVLKKGVTRPVGSPAVYQEANEEFSDVAKGIAGGIPVFEYYDSSYDGTQNSLSEPVNISSIRLVKITLVSESSSDTRLGVSTTSTQVSIRGLKDNL